MRISATVYLDVVSSWCYWGEATWTELKRRYDGRVAFDWKIALMDPEGLPKSEAQEAWFYRRSGLMNKAAFMLRTDWYEPVLPEYLAPNLVAEAARDLGVKDDRVRVAISHATLRTGAPQIRELAVAAEIAAKASGLEQGSLLARAQLPEVEARVRASTAEWKAMGVSQRPTFVLDTEIGDRAIFSGVVKVEAIAATLDSMLEDAAFYEAYAAHHGGSPES
ncbi:MAG: DsbA family protein [Verrucomicrobiota bacterium]